MAQTLANCSALKAWTVDTDAKVLGARGDVVTRLSATLVGGRVYVYGGYGHPLRNRCKLCYVELGRKWKWVVPRHEKGPPLSDHCSVLVRESLYMFGGETRRRQPEVGGRSLWKLDLVMGSVESIETSDSSLTPALKYAAEYIEPLDEIVVFGGTDDTRQLSSRVLAFNLQTKKWRVPIVKGGTPPARRSHCSALHRKADIYFFGGNSNGLEARSEVFLLHCAASAFTWSKPVWNMVVIGCADSTMNCMGSRLYIFGGYPGSTLKKSSALMLYDLEQDKGLRFTGENTNHVHEGVLSGSLLPLALHATVITQDKLLVLGGQGNTIDKIIVVSPQ